MWEKCYKTFLSGPCFPLINYTTKMFDFAENKMIVYADDFTIQYICKLAVVRAPANTYVSLLLSVRQQTHSELAVVRAPANTYVSLLLSVRQQTHMNQLWLPP